MDEPLEAPPVFIPMAADQQEDFAEPAPDIDEPSGAEVDRYNEPGMDVDVCEEQYDGCHQIRTQQDDMLVDSQIQIVTEDDPYTQLFSMTDRSDVIRTHNEIIATISATSGNMKAYHRERQSWTRAMVSEIYSAPRVTEVARKQRKYGIDPGVALDLTTNDENGNPWDFE